MKPSRSSATAALVSAARGVGVSAQWRDPVAHAFASERLARQVARFERQTPGVELARLVVRALSLGLVDHNTLRMLLVDRALLAWRERGVRQVVLLGAGLDSRSWRLADLSDCDVFEVDHPDTQAVKRQRVEVLTCRARSVAFVPVDFERDDLARALGASGHRSGEPTGWVCEGVSAYLPPTVMAQLLQQVSACSAPCSHLALSYVTPLAGRGAFSKALAALLVRQLGERARGFISRDTVFELLDTAGLTVLEDTGWPEWQQHFAGYRALPNAFKERLVIARKG